MILNTLGDLTNRENRAFYQRFSSDFQDLTGAAILGGDGLADDYNGDNVPDYYPTLYPTAGSPQDVHGNAIQLVYEPLGAARTALTAMAFPFVYPRAYRCPKSSAPPRRLGSQTPRLRLDPFAQSAGL